MGNESSNVGKKYYLGLDIGTDSVGWAVTDEDYHLIRKQGKHLWGSRLFPEAQTAKSRRMQREARRRFERRRQRIVLLQEIFQPEMEKVDPYFFDRLNNSALHLEDKPVELQKSKYLLFTGTGPEGLTDKKYYEQYPTIYHLRLALMEHPEKKFDLREIYLALAHMVKYRGNFLYDSEMGEESIGSALNLKEDFDALDQAIRDVPAASEENEETEEDPNSSSFVNCTDEQAQKIFDLFQKENQLSRLQEELQGILPSVPKGSPLWNVLKVATGSKVKLSVLFPDLKESLEDSKDVSVDFSDDDKWEELLSSGTLDDSRTAVLLQAKKLYDDRILIYFLKGEKSLSKAMVKQYDLHHAQLKQLKKLWQEGIRNASTPEQRKTWKQNYDAFFRTLTDVGDSYSNYIGHTSVDGKKETKSTDSLHRTPTREKLYKKLQEDHFLPDDVLNSPSTEDSDVSIREAIAEDNYLLRQNAKENGAFPYQLNLREMKQILDNQKAYYPFLGEEASDFANPAKKSYKICALLEYRVPYYVGPLSTRMPLNEEEKPIRWAVRKEGTEGVKITPWNFHDVIDEKASARGFLDRLKNSCTYLIGEKTLPLASPIYQQYMVYNEMNGWLVNGSPISTEDKDYLMENLYRKRRGVSLANIRNCFKQKYGTNVEITTSGTKRELNKDDVHASCSTYFDLKRVLGEDFDKDKKKAALAEEIAEDLTAFEDRKMRRESLIEAGLSPEEAETLSSLHYSGWGKLSKKFLTGLKTERVNVHTGEAIEYSILDLLRLTPKTMMAIYFNPDYSFHQQVEQFNESLKPTLEEILDSDYTSPAMKRALLQCVNHLIPELKKILGISEFSSYFIEFTRQEGEKKRTTSRKKYLDQVYAAAKKTLGSDEAFKAANDRLQEEEKNNDIDDGLRNRKLFYYFMQLGRDVYTGEKINLDELLSSNSHYDIDHIIPQALVKDDSFTNTVLVNQAANRNKSDTYPIPHGIVTEEGKKWIRTLNEIQVDRKPLMPKEKMDRILRPESKPLSPDEVKGFVNRQLTVTNQSTKAVADVLKKTDPDARIVYSRAENVSDFRKLFGLPKCREVNDYHHAHDAYLNIVVGNVYDMVFSRGNNKGMTRGFDEKVYEWKKEHSESLKTSVPFVFTRDERKFMTDKLVWKSKRYVLDNQKNPAIDPETGLLKEMNEAPLGDPDRHNLPTLDLVRKTLAFDDPMVTWMVHEQSQASGFFSKVTLHSAKAADATYPLKQVAPFNTGDWAKKYGGYGDLVTPYFMLVKSDGKKDQKTAKVHHVYSIEGIPSIYLAGKDKEEATKDYLENNLGLKNPVVLIPKLLIGTILEVPALVDSEERKENGSVRVGITGRSGLQLKTINLVELHLPKNQYSYFKLIARALGTNSSTNKKPDFGKYKNIGHGEIRLDKYSVLTQEKNRKTFDVLVNALQRPCFKNLPGVGGTFKTLPCKKDVFASLDTLSQIQVLQNILLLVSCKPGTEDLSPLGLGKNIGGKCVNKKLMPGAKVIFSSATGFHEKVVFQVPED